MKLASAIVLALCVTASAQPAPTAEALYAEGQAAYDRKDFATAVTRWQASYKASGEPGLLFLLGQALRQNGKCKEALYSYRRFLALDATDEHRPFAEDFVRELAPLCDAPAPKPQPAQPIAAPSDNAATERIAGIATAGGGAALLLTGIVLGAHAQALGDDVTRACRSSAVPPCDWATEKPTDDAGRRDATVGRVFDVVGVAGIVGGAAMYYLGMRGEVAVAPIATARASGAVLTWSSSW